MMSMGLDLLMIGLLALTIWFCWRLNGKILALKESRYDLSEMVKTFDSAIVKTHKNVAELKSISTSSATELQLYINKAGELIGDLSFMTEAAGKLADRLEGNITKARGGMTLLDTSTVGNSASKPKHVASAPKIANDASNLDTTFTRASKDLLQAIRSLEEQEK